jgi:hypothetical protein
MNKKTTAVALVEYVFSKFLFLIFYDELLLLKYKLMFLKTKVLFLAILTKVLLEELAYSTKKSSLFGNNHMKYFLT